MLSTIPFSSHSHSSLKIPFLVPFSTSLQTPIFQLTSPHYLLRLQSLLHFPHYLYAIPNNPHIYFYPPSQYFFPPFLRTHLFNDTLLSRSYLLLLHHNDFPSHHYHNPAFTLPLLSFFFFLPNTTIHLPFSSKPGRYCLLPLSISLLFYCLFLVVFFLDLIFFHPFFSFSL